MKKILLITLVFAALQGQAQSKHRAESDFRARLGVGLLAGGAFVAAGLLQQPDERWEPSRGPIQAPNAWRRESFFEDRERVAAVASGIFLFSLVITVRF